MAPVAMAARTCRARRSGRTGHSYPFPWKSTSGSPYLPSSTVARPVRVTTDPVVRLRATQNAGLSFACPRSRPLSRADLESRPDDGHPCSTVACRTHPNGVAPREGPPHRGRACVGRRNVPDRASPFRCPSVPRPCAHSGSPTRRSPSPLWAQHNSPSIENRESVRIQSPLATRHVVGSSTVNARTVGRASRESHD